MICKDTIVFTGDKIVYLKDGIEIEGKVVSVTGDRLWLESGYVTYHSQVVKVL